MEGQEHSSELMAEAQSTKGLGSKVTGRDVTRRCEIEEPGRCVAGALFERTRCWEEWLGSNLLPIQTNATRFTN